ncbi:MAG TPA: hypothetical protein VHL34_04360 [Rhizomicrobium sp.]|nr:hypothetical protein [Rhizomicrobium sp.]
MTFGNQCPKRRVPGTDQNGIPAVSLAHRIVSAFEIVQRASRVAFDPVKVREIDKHAPSLGIEQKRLFKNAARLGKSAQRDQRKAPRLERRGITRAESGSAIRQDQRIVQKLLRVERCQRTGFQRIAQSAARTVSQPAHRTLHQAIGKPRKRRGVSRIISDRTLVESNGRLVVGARELIIERFGVTERFLFRATARDKPVSPLWYSLDNRGIAGVITKCAAQFEYTSRQRIFVHGGARPERVCDFLPTEDTSWFAAKKKQKVHHLRLNADHFAIARERPGAVIRVPVSKG